MPNKNLLYTTTLASILGLASLAISSNSVSAETTSGKVNLETTVAESISMTITGNNDTEECISNGFNSCSTFGTVLPNQFTTTSSKVSVLTNSVGGYSLSVKAESSADMKTEDNKYSIPAGTLTNEDGGQSLWSYKTDGTGIKTDWTKMTTTDTVIKGTTIYSAEDSDTTITYGLSTSSTQATGAYTTTLVYTATAPNTTDVKEPELTINLGEGIYGATIKAESLDGENIGLVETNGGKVKINKDKNYYIIPLYQSGYTLDSITPNGGTTTEGTNGYYYYKSSGDETNEVTLTGKTLTTALTDSSLTTMQDMTSCPSIPTAVRDSRDDSVYYVQTLADGNCWMLENLRLIGGTTLTPADSNVEVDYTIPTNVWTLIFTEGRVNSDYNTTTVTGYGPGRNYVGTYYNYCAASAGTRCTDSSTNPGDDGFNVCPARWTIPSGGTNGLYMKLTTVLSGAEYRYLRGVNTKIYNHVLSTLLSGYFQSTARKLEVSSDFWSSTQAKAGSAEILFITPSNIFTQLYYVSSRGNGSAVRCVLK